MSDDQSASLREIEKNQAELRKSIERSRELADKSQELLDKHRRATTASGRTAAEQTDSATG